MIQRTVVSQAPRAVRSIRSTDTSAPRRKATTVPSITIQISSRRIDSSVQVLGWDSLQDTLKSLPAPDTRLHLDLQGRDPDDGMNDIAYEKGALFLRTVERTVGRDRFDAWLRGYFDRNAYRPMTTAMFLDDIRTHLVKGDAALESQLQLDAWVYQPGLPSNAVAPVSHAFEPVDAAAVAFFKDKGPASAIPWADWNTQQRQRFLGWRPEGLAANADWLTNGQLADLERREQLVLRDTQLQQRGLLVVGVQLAEVGHEARVVQEAAGQRHRLQRARRIETNRRVFRNRRCHYRP